jgi:tetratricopeptide (TPR) repeat protein
VTSLHGTQDQFDLESQYESAKSLLARGALDSALDVAEKILTQNNEFIDAIYLQAVCLRYQKHNDLALKKLANLLEKNPKYSRGHQEKGHNFLAQKNIEASIKAYTKAVEYNPALTASWSNLGKLFREVGNIQGAKNAEKEVRYLQSLPKEIFSSLSFFHENKLHKAENLCRSYLQQQPKHPEGMRLLSKIALKLYVLDEAEFLLESCLEFYPEFRAARHDYVNVLHKREKFPQALQQAKILFSEDPDNPVFKTLYANQCVAAGKLDIAITIYKDLSEKSPQNPQNWLNLGHALKTQGETTDAILSYRNAAEIKSDLGDAYWSLANLKTYQFSTQELNAMESAEANNQTAAEDRYHLCFALGKAYEDLGDFSKSFNYYDRGNRLKRDEIKYRPERIENEIRMQKQVCDKNLFLDKKQSGFDAKDPIFIVGLPRSGSTLLEQILASHPLIEGTLELPNILALAAKLNGRQHPAEEAKNYPYVLAELSTEQLKSFGQAYIESTRIYRDSAPFFIDKMPNNFRHIGLIKLILPNAKIIDARRDPLACGFSLFKQLFAVGQHFSYSLEDVGQYYGGYVDLMSHWDKVLPGEILRVNYEEVVGDLECQVRRILDFCEIPFDNKCLDFHKTERAVRTASSEQVRQPIYQSGLEHWKCFEQHLDPLKQSLEEHLSRP